VRLGDRQSETDTGGPGSVLMVLPSFGGARESRNLLHGAHAFSIWADGALRFGTRQPVSNVASGLAAPRVAEGFGMTCKHYPRAGRFTTLPRVLGSRKSAHASMSVALWSGGALAVPTTHIDIIRGRNHANWT
jgi:hypothetical protein